MLVVTTNHTGGCKESRALIGTGREFLRYSVLRPVVADCFGPRLLLIGVELPPKFSAGNIFRSRNG